MSSEFFSGNRSRLMEAMPEGAMALLHSNDVMPTSADGVMPFVQDSDMIYLSGIDQEETVLLLYPSAPDPKQREILFVRRTDEHLAIWEGEKFTKEAATLRSGVQNVQWTENFDGLFGQLVVQADEVLLNSNEHARAACGVETRAMRLNRECQAKYPLHRYGRLAPLLHVLRAVKQEEEVQAIRRACAITEAGFRRVLGMMAPGVGEWEVEAEYTHEFLKSGSRGHAYSPIVGGGKNACVLHYVSNHERLQAGDLVLMDVGAECSHWNADMTRTVPVSGKYTERQAEVYNAVLEVMRYAASIVKPGVMPKEYTQLVLEKVQQALIGLGLIDAAEAADQDDSKPLVRRYFMHGVSHHLGLDVHDVAPSNEAFAEGHVITIEPGIYIREENIGIRIENNYRITADGVEDLMATIPVEIEEIERLMAR
nr:aminopeptidase P N-terminal domain-containing protein [Rubritalea marina]